MQVELTSCLSSSDRVLSIWSNIEFHFTRCASTVAVSWWQEVELFLMHDSWSWTDGNSFNRRKGSSVRITERTLFLLRRSAAGVKEIIGQKPYSIWIHCRKSKRPTSKTAFNVLKEKFQPLGSNTSSWKSIHTTWPTQ